MALDVTLVVVGADAWEQYTRPLLDTLRRFEPDVPVVVVDAASNPPYPHYPGVTAARMKRLGYAAALNFGAGLVDPDWYMFLNNDVYFRAPFVYRFAELDPHRLHGMNTYQFGPYPYICGWCMMVSRELWRAIGEFDANLTPMWFEDADYSIRAQRAGFELETHDRAAWGVIHIEDENMDARKRYMNKNMPARQANRAYVMRKHGLK